MKLKKVPLKIILSGQTVDCRLKTQFFAVMNISKTRGYLTPYNVSYFEQIQYNQPSRQKLNEIIKRLEYSKKIYIENDKKRLNRRIKLKKGALMAKYILRLPKRFMKRFIGYCLRKAKLVRCER